MNKSNLISIGDNVLFHAVYKIILYTETFINIDVLSIDYQKTCCIMDNGVILLIKRLDKLKILWYYLFF